MAKVEIVGIEKLRDTLKGFDKELESSIIRNIARKVSNPLIKAARVNTPIKTGRTRRTIGVLKVKNRKQPFIEIGFRGQSLGYLFIKGTKDRRSKNGKTWKGVKAYDMFEKASEQAGNHTKKEYNLEIGKVIAKHLRRKGYKVR